MTKLEQFIQNLGLRLTANIRRGIRNNPSFREQFYLNAAKYSVFTYLTNDQPRPNPGDFAKLFPDGFCVSVLSYEQKDFNSALAEKNDQPGVVYCFTNERDRDRFQQTVNPKPTRSTILAKHPLFSGKASDPLDTLLTPRDYEALVQNEMYLHRNDGMDETPLRHAIINSLAQSGIIKPITH